MNAMNQKGNNEYRAVVVVKEIERVCVCMEALKEHAI